MGIWGLELYQNDTALDIRDKFEELYNRGESVPNITDKLICDYNDIMGDANEESLFWFALADTQWDFGVLLDFVKEKALFWIEKNYIFNHIMIDTENNVVKDRILRDLKEKILSPQPKSKKIVKKNVYKCRWKIWDVFAYRLESELAKERGLYGRYFLIQKIDEYIWWPGHIVPIIYVKITDDDKIPSNRNEYDQLQYVQTSFTKYEDRFFPIDMRCPQEDIARKSKMDYTVDEYGFLPEYRAILLNTSKRVIPSKLEYVGNFAHSIRPEKEFVPHSKDNIITVSWQRFDETFEIKMIKRYCWHNLRELIIYKNINT